MGTILDRFAVLEEDRRRYGNMDELIQRKRINALCSMFYFGKEILKRRDLNTSFHFPLMRQLQKLTYKDLIRVSRGHLKSTIASEILPMWRTLRVLPRDIEYLQKQSDRYGKPYTDEFFQYLLAVHRPDSTWILCSEVQALAVDLQARIKLHFEENQNFRVAFRDLLPYAVCHEVGRFKGPWGSHKLTIQRDDLSVSEPTFQAQGAGQALQSKHVTGGVIEDDVVGEKSLKSATETRKRINWHTRLAGLFYDDDKDHAGNQLLIGNDWHGADLNHHVMQNEKWFDVHTSGCLWCDTCKVDTIIDLGSFKLFDKSGELLCVNGHPCRPVFPEKFTLKKIHQIWSQMKAAANEGDFSCQYLNSPGATSDSTFQSAWIKYYELIRDEGNHPHSVKFLNAVGEWETKKIENMNRYMFMDPSYGALSINACQTGLPVIAVDDKSRVFLLEDWVWTGDLSVAYNKANEFAEQWGIDIMWTEGSGAGKAIGHNFNDRNSQMGKSLRSYPVMPHGEYKAFNQDSGTPINDRKLSRIYALQPYLETSFYIRKDQRNFINQYNAFTTDRTRMEGVLVDLLDALSYFPQVAYPPATVEDMAYLEARLSQYLLEAGQDSYR